MRHLLDMTRYVILLSAVVLFVGGVAAAEEPEVKPLYVRAYGSGEGAPLVFLHGGPGYNSVSFEFSAAEALRDKIDSPLPPAEQETLHELQAQIQVELGPAFTGECLEIGREMSMDDAIAFARNTITAGL